MMSSLATLSATAWQPRSKRLPGRLHAAPHLSHHLPLRDTHPAMAMTGAVGDRSLVSRLGPRQEFVELVDGVVEEEIVSLADPDVDLALKLGTKNRPVLLEHPAQVIRLPVCGCRAVDRSRPGIPERDGTAVVVARTIGGVPGAPLAPRHRPRIAAAQYVFKRALVPHRVADLARLIPSRGALEAVAVDVRIVILINIDQLKRSKIDPVGAERPGAVPEVRIENLQGQGDPAAGRAAVEHACRPPPDAPEGPLDVGYQFPCHGVAVRAVVGRVDLVRIAQRPGAVKPDENHPWSVVGHPEVVERRSRGHSRADPGEPGAVTADVHPQGIAPVGLTGEVARQDDTRTQKDRPAVKRAQERRANLHVPDQLGIRRQSLFRNGPRQLEWDRAAERGVKIKTLDRTVEI